MFNVVFECANVKQVGNELVLEEENRIFLFYFLSDQDKGDYRENFFGLFLFKEK